MKHAFGMLLWTVGHGIAAFAGFVALAFGAVCLIGVIGTGGREGGKELMQVLAIGVPVVLAGLGIGALGGAMKRKQPAADVPRDPAR